MSSFLQLSDILGHKWNKLRMCFQDYLSSLENLLFRQLAEPQHRFIPRQRWSLSLLPFIEIYRWFQGQRSKVDSAVTIKMSLFIRSSIHSIRTQRLNIDICVSSFKKERFIWMKLHNGSYYICVRGNKPATHTSCHFSKWLPIKQNDFVVHHRLNSAWNVINLYKSWKQSLSLVSDSDKLRGHWLVMMFDCQPRITSEREGRAGRYNGKNVPYSASTGLGVFSSPRGGQSLRHYEKNWLQTCAASVLLLCFLRPTQNILQFSTLDNQQRFEKWMLFSPFIWLFTNVLFRFVNCH